MKLSHLIRRSLFHYWQTNLAVLIGVSIAVGVLAGSLLVGDSVRGSLRHLFLSRLGGTDVALSAPHFFREALAAELARQAPLRDDIQDYTPLIQLQGQVVNQISGRRIPRVSVYGVDDRFWRFHFADSSSLLGPEPRETFLSPELWLELGLSPGEAVLVRVEKPSDIPAGTLHGRRDEAGHTMRFAEVRELVSDQLGEFSLLPTQDAVRAAFVPMRRLQEELNLEGRINSILLSLRGDRGDSLEVLPVVERSLRDSLRLEDVRLKLRGIAGGDELVLESATTILSREVEAAALSSARSLGLQSSPILTYLANTIRMGSSEIPYSLVTALDDARLQELPRWSGLSTEGIHQAAEEHPSIYLNEWAARELDAKEPGIVELEYYVWEDRGVLSTQQARFRLGGIVRMEGPARDPELAPSYPGITDSETVSDWDPPFPMDLSRIQFRDEEYWDRYRTAPKAFIALSVGNHLWASRFGRLTSLRLRAPVGTSIEDLQGTFERSLLERLNPVAAGFSIQPVRALGLEASHGATDFGEYFVYFSFFLVLAALLLSGLFFRLGIEMRLRELGTLRALGFPVRVLRRLFLSEGALLALAGSAMGLVAALLYSGVILYGLRSWWVDAVGTQALHLRVEPVSLALGGAGGVAAALLGVLWTLRGLHLLSPRSLLAGRIESTGATSNASGRAHPTTVIVSIVCGLLGLLLVTAGWMGWVGPSAAFFGAGLLLLVALLSALLAWFGAARQFPVLIRGRQPIFRLGIRNAAFRPSRSVLCISLIASAWFIIASVDVFRLESEIDWTNRDSGTGGFQLVVDASIPFLHNPETPEGLEDLSMAPSQHSALADVNMRALRVRPGEDASCLNLYRPQEPRIAAIGRSFREEGRFSFHSSLAATAEEAENPWRLLERQFEDGAVPAVADISSLTYVLHRGLGEDFEIARPGGDRVRLRFVAALVDSILQSELIISEENFLDLFPEHEGYSMLLVESRPDESDSVAELLRDQLSDFAVLVETTRQRLGRYRRVENAYLTTFQSLGGLGLILGSFGLATVLLRNVLEKRRELALLKALGYRSRHFVGMVLAENLALLGFGLAVGSLCAVVAMSPALAQRSGQLLPLSLATLLAAVVVCGLLASVLATRTALRTPLLESLRGE